MENRQLSHDLGQSDPIFAAMGVPKIIINISEWMIDNMQSRLSKGPILSIAAALFSIYAFEVLKKKLESVDELCFFSRLQPLSKTKIQKEKSYISNYAYTLTLSI